MTHHTVTALHSPAGRLRTAPRSRATPNTGEILRRTRDIKLDCAGDLEGLVYANLMAAEMAVLSVSERSPDEISGYAVLEARDRARELAEAFDAFLST